jgi:uncharacterized membrane protein YgdD (TMEM256/DUF423 family)
MHRTLFIAAVSGLIVVLLGAFGAHALETRIPAALLDTWQTAVQYQMFHTLALVGVGILQREPALQAALQRVAAFFLAGIVIFCGSLYVLALSGLTWLGMVTPIGGLLFLAGWLQLARLCYGAARHG